MIILTVLYRTDSNSLGR